MQLFHGWQGSDESAAFTEMSGQAPTWGVPLFLGEWGAPPSTDELAGYLDAIRTQLDRGAGVVGAVGLHAGLDADGQGRLEHRGLSASSTTRGALRPNFQLRPYARRIAGTPTALTVTDETDAEEERAGARAGPTIRRRATTEIFAPVAWFGGSVQIDADGDVKCTRAGDVVSCTAASAGKKSVRIAAPSSRCGLTGLEAILAARVGQRCSAVTTMKPPR